MSEPRTTLAEDAIESYEALLNADLSYATLPDSDPRHAAVKLPRRWGGHVVRNIIEAQTWEDDLAALRERLAIEAAPLDIDPTIWTWYGDWPEQHHGTGDGWLHTHPDGTRWVHPKKECAIAAAYTG